MFSTSMIASSTTSPIAITRPARTIVLIVAPMAMSTSVAAIERERDRRQADQGRPPVEEERDEDDRRRGRSRRSSPRARLSSDRSMNVGGAEDGRVEVHALRAPARRASRAFSTLRVTSRVLPVGCFSTIRSRPGPSLITASPIGGGKPILTSATSPSRRGTPLRKATVVRARSSGVVDRRAVADGDPLVGHVDEPARGDGRRVGHGLDDRVERDAVGAEPVGVDQHLVLRVALAPDRDVRDARDRHQPGPDRPLRQHASGPSARASSTTRRS